MRWVWFFLILACLAIQYPLRLGDSGYKRVDDLNQQLAQQKATNQAMMARNAAMQAEIDDLKSGTQALEDYAREEMNMVESDEVLVRILTPNENAPVEPIRIGPSTSAQAPSNTNAAENAALKKDAQKASNRSNRTTTTATKKTTP